MAISWVQQGYIQVAGELTYNPDSFDGVKLESPRGLAWLESISSFRFEPTGDGKPYTVRKEASGYWYGYRRVSGKLHKKYIGKSSETSVAKLEEIAEALNIPPQPRVTDKVTQVTQISDSLVTDKVTDTRNADRLTTLELQVQALQESLEALRSELLGKPEGLSNSSELPNPSEVTDSELQIELSNLKTELSNLATENEKIRADYDALLESSTVVTKKLDQEVQKLRSQLETEKNRGEEIWEEFSDTEQALAEVRSENSELKKICAELRSQLETERADREEPEDSEFLKEENEGLKRLLNKKSPLALSDFYVELQKLRERHREYRLKTGEERRSSIVQMADLKHQAENMERSNQEKQVRLDELEIQTKTLQAELFDARAIIASSKPTPAETALRLEIGELQSELAELKQKSAAASELPEAADLLNQLKARRKKSSATLADLEAILEILES
jgi:chromosome segregation ATPase